MRAYPAKAKNSSPAACSTLPRRRRGAASGEPTRGRHPSASRRRHDHGQQARRARPPGPTRSQPAPTVCTPPSRSAGEDDDGGDRRPAGARQGAHVRPERQRHGRAARGLADHEPPPGEVAPGRPEALPAVDVGAAGGGWTAASSAEEVALAYATTAATTRPSSSAGAPRTAAAPTAAKTPAPTIAPSPTTTASPTPSARRSSGSLTSHPSSTRRPSGTGCRTGVVHRRSRHGRGEAGARLASARPTPAVRGAPRAHA